MAQCPGKHGKSTCNGLVYRCKKCGKVGCDRGGDGECTNQGFRGNKCRGCGKMGDKELVR